MVNAGRILIMPRGEWDALTSYNMLDLVTKNGVAYLAKQANVGQDPALDTTMTYWQTFGSAVVPDNDTIIYDGDGDLAVNLDGTTLKYDAVNSYIKVAIDGVTLKYDSVNGYIYADVSTSLAGLDDVQLTSIQNGQIIAYNSTSQKFVNIDLPVGGGSKIKVTTAEATLYGQTVTLSDGVTTLSGTFSNSGEYTFEGVELTGNLTISSSDGNDRATRTLTVQYYSSYAVALAFFEATVTVTFPYTEGASCSISDGVTTIAATGSPMAFSIPNAGTWTATVTLDGASKTDTVTITTDGQTEALTIAYGTINVTYDNDFRGVSITCTQGGTTITKTAPSGGNTMEFYPPTTGTWVIEGTVGGSPYSTSVTVSSLSTAVPANLETIPDGSTKTPTDDVGIWLACAGIKDKAYTTLSQVIGDSETFNALLGDSNACAYMARSTTFATTLCADQYSMNLIGQYDTACDALLSDATWASAIANSTYFESVLNVKVPIMTSNTTPEGEANQSSFYANDNFKAWAAFAPKSARSNGWIPNASEDSGTPWIQYKFTSPVKVNMVTTDNGQSTVRTFTTKLEGSNDDGATFDVIDTSIVVVDDGTTRTFAFANDTAYSLYRLTYLTNTGTSWNIGNGLKLQFYGRTTSSEKVHGANGESAYILDGGSPVTITDPSTLNAGTYTVYSTVAKDASNLSNDYSKTVRICPNTKEIVVRPDNALYWWGYKTNDVVGTPNGVNFRSTWTSANNAQFNTYDITISTPVSGTCGSCMSTTTAYQMSKLNAVAKSNSTQGSVNICTNASWLIAADGTPNVNGNVSLADTSNAMQLFTATATDPTRSCYVCIDVFGNSVANNASIYAVWYE